MTSKACGPAVLARLLKLYGIRVSQWEIVQEHPLGNNGWSIDQLIDAAAHWGVKLTPERCIYRNNQQLTTPIILLFNNHFILVEECREDSCKVFDPIIGVRKITSLSTYFNDDKHFIAIYALKDCDTNFKVNPSKDFSLLKYFLPLYSNYKSLFIQIFIVLMITGAMQFVLPFISRSIIDTGIGSNSWDFIKILLSANICLILGVILGNFIQTYLSSYISNKVKIHMLDNYVHKLLKFSITTISQLKIGDILQRVSDTERIQTFVTNSFFQSIFSFALVFVYAIVLAYFDHALFCVFLILVIVYITWILLFLKKRKELDFDFWKIKSDNNKLLINISNTMFDIKGFGYENNMLERWRSNIGMLLNQNMRFLHFSQIQDVGTKVILQSVTLVMIYLSCFYVFEGEMTLGSLFAVMYIIGMLNTPLQHIGESFNQFQLAIISLQRLCSFNLMEADSDKYLSTFPRSRDLILQNIAFRYPGSGWILKSLNIRFKNGLKYGVIGKSGSGKSTLLKLIAGLYPPSTGIYLIGSTNSKSIHPRQFNKIVSFCIQESAPIDGSILENIVVDCNNYDESRLIKCVEIASIRREIESLPKSYDTILSHSNMCLSKGQIQRILIARAIYKDADIYLFDEIINCLGEQMGNDIIEKIDLFLKEKTRIYTTHRHQILKNSDYIYYLQDGYVSDLGTYEELHKRSRL